MKKFYISALAMALLCGSAYGQQLPNADFEGTWSACTPWTAGYGSVSIGENPADWCISHVMGITVKETVFIVPVAAGTGAKALGENVAGYNGSNSAVKLTNGQTGAMSIYRVVPGYLTLGTTWSTAKGSTTSTHDGGTWGGVNFTNRPDGFEFMYKREYASADATSEEASFIMYLWKGSASQASVPVTITASKAPSTATMENRDRNILFKDEATTTGGAISYSDDFELIAKAIVTEAGAVDDWTKKTVELEYLSTSAPSMANLIFAANNYFNTAEATNGNSLTVDDVRLLYYSRLASINVNGEALEGFDSNTFEYDLTATTYPGEGAVEVTCLGNSGSAISSIAYDEENYRVVITVTNTNAGGTDADGEASHTYTLQFAAPAVEEPEPAGLTYRRKYTDGSSRYYNEISYLVGDNAEIQTAYYTADPLAEDYYVTPLQNQWQEEGAYIDFKDKVIEIPADAENFTMILKGLSGSAINWSQSCVYVDWNNNGSFIDDGETNGVINLGVKPNVAGGGMVMTETGDRDLIYLPADVKEGDTFSILICLTEPKGVDGTGDKWGDNWEWSKEIFVDNLCSLINGQAYELTVKITKPSVVKSALTITQPENAVITVMNGDAEVASGDEIEAGTELTLSAEVEAGYVFSQFTLNGQPIEGNTFTMPEEACTISADIAAVDYCEATGTTQNPNNRGISQITVNGTTISGPGTSKNRAIFADHTDTEIVVKPGETVSLTANGSHTWMMGFIYVDYDNNGWNVDPEQIGLNGDLVWYEQMVPVSQLKVSDETTYDMEGNAITGNARNCEISDTKDLEASFVIPENLAEGTYRARFKIDWASNEPCGSSVQGQSLSANGGTMIDFTFRVEAEEEVAGRTVSVAVAEGQSELGSVAIEGSDDLTVTTEDDVTVTATAVEGAQFLGWYNADELVSTEATYTVSGEEDINLTASFGWTVTFAATDGTLTVKANDAELTSGNAVVPGTEIEITATPAANKELDVITINGNTVDATEGVVNYTVVSATEIAATFKAIQVTYTQSWTGNGKVEAWTQYDTMNDDAPAGDIIPDGSLVDMGSAINIYLIPGEYGNNQRETFAAILITNGDDEYTLANKGFEIVAPWYDKKNLTLFTRVKGDFNVNVTFSDELAGITDVFFDGVEGETEYFTLQGVKVAAENLETGFYIARRGNKTIKVYITK